MCIFNVDSLPAKQNLHIPQIPYITSLLSIVTKELTDKVLCDAWF